MSVVAGVDVGTSGIKWMIIDIEKHKIMKEGRLNYCSVSRPKPPADLRTIENAFNKVLQILTQSHVDSIGIASMAPVLVVLGRKCEPLDAIFYNSSLGAEYLSECDLKETTEKTLNPPNISMFYHKIRWLNIHRPSVMRKAEMIVDLNGFLFGKLMDYAPDELVQDLFTAFDWGLVNFRVKKWWEEQIQKLQIADKLPTLVQPEHVDDYKGKTVSIGTLDVLAGSLGVLGLSRENAFSTFGSTLCSSIVSEKPTNATSLFTDLFFEGKFLVNGCTSQFSTIVQWAEKIFRMKIKIGEVRPSPLPLVFVPYLLGERSPIFDPKARAAYVGMSMNTTTRDMIESLVHSLSYMAADLILELELTSDRKLRQVIVGGGLAAEPIVKLVASVTEKEHRIIQYNPTAFGAALISMRACAMVNGYSSGDAQTILRGSKIVSPDPKLSGHKEVFGIFKTAYRANRTVFEWVSEIESRKQPRATQSHT